MATKTYITYEQIPDKFFEIEIPSFEWLKINLVHDKKSFVNVKTKELEKVEDNFKISIDISQQLKTEDKEMSNKIKEICKLPFVPYYWREKSYNFYTMERTGTIEEKKEMLINLFNFLKNYEIEKKEQFKESNKVFKEDFSKNFKAETPDLFIKVHEPTNKFIVLAKDYIGADKFSLLRKCSDYIGKLSNTEIIDNEDKNLVLVDFFKDDLPNKKLNEKMYFIINPSFYEEIKLSFLQEEKVHDKFLQEQKKVSESIDLSQYNIEEDNVFKLKIKFNEKDQCFDFYGVGYFDNKPFESKNREIYVSANPRTLLGFWAINHLYIQDLEPNKYCYAEDIMGNKDKIELDFVKGGSKKDKNMKVPASEWPKIKKIKENYLEQMKIWGRPEKTIRISHCEINTSDILKRYPLVYFDNKGKSFLIYNARKNGIFKSIGQDSLNQNNNLWLWQQEPKPIEMIKIDENFQEIKKRETKFSQSFKSIPISFEEAKYFMEEHLFAEYIKNETINFNVSIRTTQNINNLSKEEELNIFNTVILHAEIQDQAEKNKLNNISKPKKIKI